MKCNLKQGLVLFSLFGVVKINWAFGTLYYIVMYRPIARQRLGKHNPAEEKAQQYDVSY
jgi:hypothetical protein